MILDESKIYELDGSQFEMNADHFMLLVFFHNLKGFYLHIIKSYIYTKLASLNIQVTPMISEK